ncbi:hypothetical protein V494_04090, partial [Pseudogymnoascus sp. VKM F-4513 (FW-928)]
IRTSISLLRSPTPSLPNHQKRQLNTTHLRLFALRNSLSVLHSTPNLSHLAHCSSGPKHRTLDPRHCVHAIRFRFVTVPVPVVLASLAREMVAPPPPPPPAAAGGVAVVAVAAAAGDVLGFWRVGGVTGSMARPGVDRGVS